MKMYKVVMCVLVMFFIFSVLFVPGTARADMHKGYSAGTGYFVNTEGDILTNAHVIDRGVVGDSVVIVYQGKQLPGVIKYISDKRDVGVVNISTNNSPCLLVSGKKPIMKGDTVYPVILDMREGQSFGKAEIIKLPIKVLEIMPHFQFQGKPFTYINSAVAEQFSRHGDSGSPVVNSKNVVIGMVYAGAVEEVLGIEVYISSGILQGAEVAEVLYDSNTSNYCPAPISDPTEAIVRVYVPLK